MEREDLEFRSQGDRCAAWLYPATEERNSPAVVMAHGLSGTRRDGLGPFAERFADAGISALLFDHRGFGDSVGEPDLFSPARQLDDWRAAIACARELPGVDPARIATFGSSMGGGNALAAAADDPRVAAAVSQVPFIDLMTQSHRSAPVVAARMLLAAARGEHLPAVGSPQRGGLHQRAGGGGGLASRRRDRRGLPLAQPRLLALAAGPALSAGPPCAPAPLPLAGLRRRGRPGRAPGPAIRAARAAPRGELRLYPGVDHFDIYDGPEFEAVVADEVDFLRRRLLEPADRPPPSAAEARRGSRPHHSGRRRSTRTASGPAPAGRRPPGPDSHRHPGIDRRGTPDGRSASHDRARRGPQGGVCGPG